MKIRTKILASHGLTALAVTLVCVALIAILRLNDATQRELHSSYEQIRAINLIAAAANDYAEQVAELYILGTDPTDLVEAREELIKALDRKQRLVEEELDYLTDPVEIIRERIELDRIEAMRQASAALDEARKAATSALTEGNLLRAGVIYRDQIEHRFDSALGDLIDSATRNERSEVDAAIAGSALLSDRMRTLALGLAAFVLLLGGANALLLHRTISRPIAALAAGADAVARGELSHIVTEDGRDELGNLARRFNLMTSQIRNQRDRLMSAKAELERQVDDRTSELRQRGAELEAANARLRELDTSRAQFLADISHELRTPLTVLRGQAEVTLRSPDSGPETMRQALGVVVRKADQMGRLVEDLLFLARSEAGTIGIEKTTVVLQDVLADVLLDTQSMSRRENVTISARQPTELVVVRGDARRLRQAVLIPIDNAIKLAPAGSAVSVELAAGEDAATIVVRDQGPGFTPEEAERAFTRFFRGSVARGRSGRGSGLGLSIARWIIDQHGGSISIDSVPGEGATVRIELPLGEAA